MTDTATDTGSNTGTPLTATSDPFADFESDVRQQVWRAGRRVRVPAGWSLALTGDPAEQAYVLLEGVDTLAFPRSDFEDLRRDVPAFHEWVTRTAQRGLDQDRRPAAQWSTVLDTVVLDVDGTLVDSVYLHVDVWAQAFGEVGVHLPGWRLHRAIGMGGDKLVAELAGQAVEDEHGDRVRARHDELFADSMHRVSPLPGAADLLAALAERPVTVVVGSSGNPDHTRRLLEIVDGPDVIATVVTSEDAEETKPAPDVVEVAVDRVDGDRALVVGDAVWDMQAARQRGRPAVGLRSGGFGEDELRDAGASWVFDDPAELVEHLDELPLGRRPSATV